MDTDQWQHDNRNELERLLMKHRNKWPDKLEWFGESMSMVYRYPYTYTKWQCVHDWVKSLSDADVIFYLKVISDAQA
jgi:hypothetical protein